MHHRIAMALLPAELDGSRYINPVPTKVGGSQGLHEGFGVKQSYYSRFHAEFQWDIPTPMFTLAARLEAAITRAPRVARLPCPAENTSAGVASDQFPLPEPANSE
jgi:hypothetical protein